MKLFSKGDQHYESEDGRVVVTLDPTFETECDLDTPHPMRMKATAFEAFAPHYRQHLASLGAQRKGNNYVWHCPGGESHWYSLWTVQIDGEWTDDSYDTFKEALGVVEAKVGERVTVARRRKEKPVEDTFVQSIHEGFQRFGDALEELDAAEAYERRVLADELRALDENIDRMVSTLATEDGPYVDLELLAQNRRRKAEVEKLLLVRSRGVNDE